MGMGLHLVWPGFGRQANYTADRKRSSLYATRPFLFMTAMVRPLASAGGVVI
jgi:hypothetical protein